MSRRGLTVLETLVTCAILVTMMLASLVIYTSGLNRQRKQDTTTDSYRAAMTGLAHIRSQLRGSQLLSPGIGNTSGQAMYRYPRMDGNLPRTDEQGRIIWRPPVRFQLVDGKLVRTGGEPRDFCTLGDGGSLSFERLDRRLLRITVVAANPSPDVRRASRYEARVDVYLPNN